MLRACSSDDLPLGESTRVLGGPEPIAVFHTDEGLFAISDTCTHQDASLSEGWVEGCAVECPLHEAGFDLRTGMPTCLPAKRPVTTYPVEVVDGVVWVRVVPAEVVA